MKKGILVALILAAALFILGVILVTVGFCFLGGLEEVSTQAEKTYVVNEAFSCIQVDATACDVTLVKTQGEFQVDCPDSEKISYTVIVEDGTLQIRQVDLRKWYDFIGIFQKEQEMRLYLPESQYNALGIHTNTGDITVSEGFTFTAIDISTSTGDVALLGCDAQNITIETDTGDVTGVLLSPKEFFIDSRTGDIQLKEHSGTTNGKCYVNSSTGDITFSYSQD